MTLRRPVDNVAPAAAFLGVDERSLRRSLAPGGELERYAFRVSPRRVLVKTELLLRDFGVSDGEAATASPIAPAADPTAAQTSVGRDES